MVHSFDSVLQVMSGKSVMDPRVRYGAAMCVKRFLKGLLETHKIEVPDEDVEEISYDIVDELNSEEYNHFSIN